MMSRGSLISIPALGKQCASKQGQATPHSEFPPKLFSFDFLEIESIPHGLARRLRFCNIPVIAALKLCHGLLVFGRKI